MKLRFALPLLAFFSAYSIHSQAQAGTCKGMTLGQNTSLNGFVPFPANDPWRQNVTHAIVDGNSDAIIATIGANYGLHPDFGSGLLGSSYMGIPYQVVNSSTPNVPVTYNAMGNESDPGPMPIPANVLIEGYPNPSGDQHALVLDRDNCFLYELYGTSISSTGAVTAASGAIWDMTNDNARPYTWTSADAAGLPIFPGLARFDEVAGGIQHALRFTLPNTKAAFVSPASHWAATSTNNYAAPMGMRLRLKASVDISKYTPQAQVILQALKTYGMILADNGSPMFISGTPNDGWNNDDLHNIGGVKASDFEVLQETPLYTAANIPSGAPPVISTLQAISLRGLSTELFWRATGASFFIVSGVGPVRGNTLAVSPTKTTTYTVYATNQFGQTSKSITVTVP